MDDMDFALIGAKMKELRSARGITQEQIAKDLGCTIGFISNVENNRAKLNLKVLFYYSKICNVPIDTIINVGEDSQSLEKQEMILDTEMKKLFHTFSVEERERIIKTLKVWQNN